MPKTKKTAPKKAAEKNTQKRKGPYSNEEVLKKLYITRDDALDWVEACAAEKTGKGSSAALAIYERAQVEIDRLERILKVKNGNKQDNAWKWADTEPTKG